MVSGVLGLKCPRARGTFVAIPHGYVHPAKAMEASSSSLGGAPNPYHAEQQQRSYWKTGESTNPAGVRREGCNFESSGSTNTSAGFVKTTNVGSEMPKCAQTSAGLTPRKGSFGGVGSAYQKSSQFSPQAPTFQFGTVGLGDSTLSASNGLSYDFPQLFVNVDAVHVSPQQTVTPGWNKEQLGNGLQLAQSSESKAFPRPVERMSAIVPNRISEVMPPKRPGERQLGGPECLFLGGRERSSKDSFPVTPPPPSIDDRHFPPLSASSAAAGNRNSSRIEGGRGPAQEAQAPLPSEHQEPKHRDEADSPTSVQGGQERERQSNLNRNGQSVYYDKRKVGDRHGAELGNGLETGDRRDGRRTNQGRDAAREKAKSIDELGRTLTRILRHQAVQMNLDMSSDGYVDVQNLLKLSMKTGANRPLLSHTIDDVKQSVQQDNKQRFGTKEENGRLFIRANQGHTIKSLKSEHLLKPIVSVDEASVCVHGTYRKILDQIFKEGLKTMKRNHVHFASGVVGSEEVISGMRSSCEVLIYLNVDKALADGMKLYISENKVILTEGFGGVVPPEYFKEVLGLPDLKPIPPPSGPA